MRSSLSRVSPPCLRPAAMSGRLLGSCQEAEDARSVTSPDSPNGTLRQGTSRGSLAPGAPFLETGMAPGGGVQGDGVLTGGGRAGDLACVALKTLPLYLPFTRVWREGSGCCALFLLSCCGCSLAARPRSTIPGLRTPFLIPYSHRLLICPHLEATEDDPSSISLIFAENQNVCQISLQARSWART